MENLVNGLIKILSDREIKQVLEIYEKERDTEQRLDMFLTPTQKNLLEQLHRYNG